MLEDEKIEDIKNILLSKLNIKLIYIFGSFGKYIERKDSDIDFAILTEKKIDEYRLFMISQKLADVLKKEIDLVDLNSASAVFRAEIVRKGKLIYYSDNLVRMDFQMKTLRDYARLNEERKEILGNKRL